MIKLNDKIIDFKHFNDGTFRWQLEDKCTAYTILWLYSNDEEIIQLYYLANHLRALASQLELIMPYIPNARQDRVNSYKDIFTLKYFCNLINSIGFDKVYVFDPHSHVSEALLNNVKVLTPKYILLDLIEDKLPVNTLVAYPDSGAEKRYRSMLKVPYVVGVKERDWETGAICKLDIFGAKHMVAGHSFLLVDDIASRGTTLYLAAKQLKELGAKNIYVYVSHCESTLLQPHFNGQSLLEIPDLITRVYTTNSIYYNLTNPKIEIIYEFKGEAK